MTFIINPVFFKFLIPFIVWIPFVELGVGIPLSLVLSKLPAWQVAILAFCGHATGIVILTYLVYHYFANFENRHPLIKHFFDKASKIKLDRFLGKKEFGIVAMLSLPLPMGGMWFAIPAAFIFNVPKKNALIAALIGSALGTIQFTFVWKLVLEGITYILKTILS